MARRHDSEKYIIYIANILYYCFMYKLKIKFHQMIVYLIKKLMEDMCRDNISNGRLPFLGH